VDGFLLFDLYFLSLVCLMILFLFLIDFLDQGKMDQLTTKNQEELHLSKNSAKLNKFG